MLHLLLKNNFPIQKSQYSMQNLRRIIRPLFQNPIFLSSSYTHKVSSPYVMSKTPAFSLSGKKLVYNFSSHQNIMKSTYEAKGYHVEQLFTGCLAIYSYYIESGDDCFIIDPLNEIHLYADMIKSRGKKLKGIFVSHYHADYVSGQHDLQKKYKCKIFMGPKSISSQTIHTMKQGEEISIGQIKLRCIHTPGHTEESSCLLTIDSSGKQDCLFTGDTLFLNEVGRPDLAVKTTLSAADLAKMLYDSIQKIKSLDENIRIYPGHGSGSSCGKSIGSGDFCSIGTQKKNNYALLENNKEKFVKKVLDEMPNPPKYFGYNANINKFEPFTYQQIQKKTKNHLSSGQVKEMLEKDKSIKVIDVRKMSDLKEGIIPGSICIGFDGALANFIGMMLEPQDKYIIIGTEENSYEAVKRMLRIGFINVLGHANFNFKEWKDNKYPISAPELASDIKEGGATVLDVRNKAEWKKDGIVEGDTVTIELGSLLENLDKLDKNKNYVLHCRSGYRATIAYSLLKGRGFDKIKVYFKTFDSIFEDGKIKKNHI